MYLRAAFQYGVKMSEGRKTRRFGGGMSDKAKEKAKLNREWQKISAVSVQKSQPHYCTVVYVAATPYISMQYISTPSNLIPRLLMGSTHKANTPLYFCYNYQDNCSSCYETSILF